MKAKKERVTPIYHNFGGLLRPSRAAGDHSHATPRRITGELVHSLRRKQAEGPRLQSCDECRPCISELFYSDPIV